MLRFWTQVHASGSRHCMTGAAPWACINSEGRWLRAERAAVSWRVRCTISACRQLSPGWSL